MKMSDVRKSNRGRKKTLTDSLRERHKKDNSAKYNKARVCIGINEYDRWTELKVVLRLKTHAEVAKILLDSYYSLSICSPVKKTKENFSPETKTESKTKENSSTETETESRKTTPYVGKNTTSTPAPPFRTSQLKLNVADVSEISSSEHETNVVPSLQTKDQRTERLNENQSFEPQLDSLDIVKDALRNTISRLKDVGGEVAAWVVIPNEDNSSLIHHMGSQKGREFIQCKPDIDAELHVFLQNYKKKGGGQKISSQATSKKKLDEESCSVENIETASCDGEPHETKPSAHSILDDCKPTNVVFSVKGSDDDSSCIVVRQEDDSSEEEPLVNTPCMTSSRQNSTEKKNLKRKISSVYMDQLSDDERLSESLEETRASMLERCEELFADKYVLAILKGKMGFPYQLLKRCGKPWFTLSGFPEDLLPFRHPSEYDMDSLKRIMQNQHKLVFNLPDRKLNETCCTMESDNNKIMTDTQKRFPQTSTLLSNSSFVPAKEIDLLKSFEFPKQVQEPHSNQKDVPSINIFTPLLQPTGDKNVAENTLLLDTHSSTTEKSNLEIRGDDSFTHIKEEPVDHEFIEFQEPSRKNSVTENTAQLDTDSSTAEKSNMVFRGDNFINQFKEEPVDYEFIYFQEAKHNNIVTESTAQLDTHSSTAEKSTVRLKEDLISDRIKEEPVDYEFQ